MSYILRRLVWSVALILIASSMIFWLVRLVPADIVDILFSTNVGSSFQREQLREFFGLDKPFYVQYGHWLGGVLRGDLGRSFRTSRPVSSEVFSRLPVTLEIILLGECLAVLIAVPLGVAAARKRNRPLDLLIQPLGLIGLSIPSFWSCSLLLIVFSIYVKGFNPLGYVPFTSDPLGNLRVVALPSAALAIVSMAEIMRVTRSSALDILNKDYIRSARAKGVSEWRVTYKHLMRNALIPIVTLVAMDVGVLIGGTIVLEEVMAIPGVGRLLVTGIHERDYPVIQGTALVLAACFIMINLVTDIIYTAIDPRIRYE
jgi:peptide/nickel transport system permease protein